MVKKLPCHSKIRILIFQHLDCNHHYSNLFIFKISNWSKKLDLMNFISLAVLKLKKNHFGDQIQIQNSKIGA